MRPRPFERLSLRTRLLCLSVALVAVGLIGTGLLVTTALHGYLQDRVDDRLAVTGQIASRLTPPSGTDSPPRVRALTVLGDTTVTYLDADGTVRRTFDADHATPGSGPDLPRLDRTAVAARDGRPFTVPDRDGEHSWRVVALPRSAEVFPPDPAGTGGSVVAATSMEEVDRTITKTRNLSLTAGVVLLAVLGVAGWFAVRSGLRPLTRIEETATAITSGDYSHRVPEVTGPHTEVGRLTACLNQMLDRIDTAFRARTEAEARTRRFFADASHELRTPLVGIKGYTDLYRMGAMPTREDIDRTMTRIAEESERLTRLVEEMFLLARLDEKGEPDAGPAFALDLAPMDLRTLAADALRDVRALDATREVALTGPGGGKPASAPAHADEARLRQVVINLIGNAVAHTPPGTPIRIGVGTEGSDAVLEVADRGPGLTDAERDRVFDRFYRADDSRARATGGSGLGLAIAHALVTAHGGRITLDTAPGRGCVFRILLPPPDKT
ncbi:MULTISPECIES: HAMP domain-containing sensor histidine kinase [unclassified Streptomyces]|uniref:sensor histidine kinase n=1 Tax=unclassified Streptomyces TaxID=2593676 RepID=UPI0007F3A0F8|nr:MULTISPECIES: HAMP domain-containing sensor histidine kinase [unclassified Streptomyces]MCM1972445.1 HAMP domain-containing histidine kinase [Streptomyces sp. G1]SBT90010.1 two-component system, OmpR family, sensor kinase [Streptomyces sp. DI166]